MRRVAILGRGGAGKSVLAQELSSIFDLPVIELDSVFWQPGPRPTPERDWMATHRQLVAGDRWIIDGDLGPYDIGLGLRLRAAEMVIVLDFALWRCVWQALRRSREQREFWAWVLRYRCDTLPTITSALATHAAHADVYVLRNPRQVRQLVGLFRAAASPG